jgi:cytochrome d ubiquinol oxidase subunit I
VHVVGWNRLQFGFTISYHYLFPQLTMGLALLLVVFKTLAVWRGDERCNELARFWGRIFGINFALGVVTGIPMNSSCSGSRPRRCIPTSSSRRTGPRTR